MRTKMSTVLPPMDLSSDHGGDEDSPLPDHSDPEAEDAEEDDDEDQPEEDLRKAA